MANRQKGFGHLETFLIAVVVVVIGGVGYWVYSNNKDSSSPSYQSSVQVVDAPDVKSSDDLNKAAVALEQAVNDQESSEIDSLVAEVDSL